MKTVSIVLCSFNGERFLKEQIESIVCQTYPIHEIIFQDDGSTDRTLEIAQTYADQYPFIRICRNTENLGFNRNFENALKKATGDFIAIADQDDIWYPQKIEKQVQAIGTHDLCISGYHTDATYQPGHMKKTIIPHHNLEYLLFYDSTPGHSMLLTREFVHRAFSLWDGHILYDWWLSVNAHLGNGIACVNEALNWHRPHQGSAIHKLNAQYASYLVKKPTWQPYLYGFKKFRKQQHLATWNFFYGYIHQQTNPHKQALAHRLSGLLLKKDLWSLFQLCSLCMRFKRLIYFYPQQKGLISYVRSFCYPMIRAYGNTYFYL